MSYSIILITDDSNDIFEYLLNKKEDVDFSSEKENVIHYSNDLQDNFVTLFRINSEDYSKKEINHIKKFIAKPSFYLLDTNVFNEAIKVIRLFKEDIPILIDNDNGAFISKDAFFKLKTFDDFFNYKETEKLS